MAKKCKKNKSELSYTLTEIGLVAEDWTITEMAERFLVFTSILKAVASRRGECCEYITFDGKLPYPLAILEHENYYKDRSKVKTMSNGWVTMAEQVLDDDGEWLTMYHIGEDLLQFARSGKTLKKYLIEKTEKDLERSEMLHRQEEADNAENNI